MRITVVRTANRAQRLVMRNICKHTQSKGTQSGMPLSQVLYHLAKRACNIGCTAALVARFARNFPSLSLPSLPSLPFLPFPFPPCPLSSLSSLSLPSLPSLFPPLPSPFPLF